MAVDNPSYFSLQGNAGSAASTATGSTPISSSSRGFSGFFRRNTNKPVTTAATSKIAARRDERSAISPRSPVAGSQRRSFRNLFRSASASADCEKTRQFLKGEPRPSDVAPPSPYLNSRSHLQLESSRFKPTRRGGPKSKTELLNMDMIFCGLPGENNTGSTTTARRVEDNEYYRFERDSDCGSEATTLPVDEEDARSYYNLTSTLPSSLVRGSPAYSSIGRRRQQQQQQGIQGPRERRRRRHSIGTFLERERCALAAAAAVASSRGKTTDLVVEPDVVDHANESARKFGTRHAPATAFVSKPSAEASNARDDVVFISSKDNEASALWVNYLTACFEQISRQQGRLPFRVTQVTFEEPLTPGTDLRVRNSRLQIVVVCPVLLERVAERPEHAANLTRQLSAERVLTMMLGVHDAHLGTNHRAALHAYASWRKFFVKDQDETFVGQFLGAAVAILGSATTGNMKIDKIGFSVHPKKVKMGANRILALLNEPLHPDDTVTVMVDRCGEALEIGHVKRRNPYTLQFSIPERCLDVSMLVGVRIARNGAPLGSRQVKCESRLRELDQILRAHDNPLEFMCQTFGFNPGDKEQLDNWMVHAFQKNIPPHFNLLSNPPGDLQISKNHSSSEENPTLLHFAARFGLEKLAWQLLECPGGDIACDMRNTNDLTPADLAEQAGHVRLAHQLRGYMQMNEFSNMYSYLKVMSENANGNANGYRAPSHQSDRPFIPTTEDDPNRQEDYCRPRPLSEAYSVPPTARPITTTCRTFPDYSTPPPLPMPNPVQPIPKTSDSGTTTPAQQPLATYSSSSTLNASSLDLPLQDYKQIQPSGLRSPDSADSTPTTTGCLSSSQLTIPQSPGVDTPTAETKPDCLGSTDQLSNAGSKSCSLSRSSQASNSSKSRESPQDELLEIINDFKNNVFTISEVERLVENWRNRNDVQQSFKDKQRQLSAMRDEYERIQKRIKEEMRAPTPFDRIRKFFTKGKKDSKDSANANEDATTSKQNSVASNLADRRPVSSLSLHSVSSSSSSGRMSTVSGCSGTSLGDSGTHSDTEDRRLQHPASEDKAAGITSYEIPPAPKPFHGRLYHQHHHHHHQQPSRYTPTPSGAPRTVGLCPSASNSELDLRAVKSSASIADDKEYYIAFPPSGLPIHSFKSNGSLKEPKTPSTPIEPHDFPIPNNINNNNNDNSETKVSDQQQPINNNYANIGPILNPPPGMCIPFQYVNITASIPKPPSNNVLTIQPDIHAIEPTPSKTNEQLNINDNNDENENDKLNENEKENEGQKSPTAPKSPKILNTDTQSQPDYTNVQIAASEEIARNFGVTLKKLPGPPVPPRCEFNFAGTTSSEVATAKTVEG